MNKNLKMMIAYDGSDNSAIDDLQFAGLPRHGEALIVAVWDSIQPAVVSDFDLVERSIVSRRVLSTAALLREQTYEATDNLRTAVAEAVENVRLYLPEWKIEGKVLHGVPGRTLLSEAAIQKPDLVVVGSHERSAVGRFFLGSVSLELAEKLNCATRVVRGDKTENLLVQPQIVAPIDDSPAAKEIVRHIGNRVWSDATKIRLVVAKDEISPAGNSKVLSPKQLNLEWAIEQLEAIGLNVSVEFSPHLLPEALLETAAKWNANSIFICARRFDESGIDGLSEAAENVLNNANCAVEIVR